jgi:hypothetical protein
VDLPKLSDGNRIVEYLAEVDQRAFVSLLDNPFLKNTTPLIPFHLRGIA